jgi:hypothetical protein
MRATTSSAKRCVIWRRGLMGVSLFGLCLAQSSPGEDMEEDRGPAHGRAVLVVQEGLGRVIFFSATEPDHRKVTNVIV